MKKYPIGQHWVSMNISKAPYQIKQQKKASHNLLVIWQHSQQNEKKLANLSNPNKTVIV